MCQRFVVVADNISISMYIICVMLCLLSALSRRVGALQISIIIIIQRIRKLIRWLCTSSIAIANVQRMNDWNVIGIL